MVNWVSDRTGQFHFQNRGIRLLHPPSPWLGAAPIPTLVRDPRIHAAGVVVTLSEGTVTLGTATANASGVWSFTPASPAQDANTIAASAVVSGPASPLAMIAGGSGGDTINIGTLLGVRSLPTSTRPGT